MTGGQIMVCVLFIAGAASLWIAGFFLGLRRMGLRMHDTLSQQQQHYRNEIAALERQMESLQNQLEIASHKIVDTESARLSVEGELSGTTLKLGRLEAKLAKVKSEISRLGHIGAGNIHKNLTNMGNTDPGDHDKRLDRALAELDWERTSHKKTQEELTRLKKHAASAQRPQTAAISTREQSQHHRLQISLTQLQHDKRLLESRLEQAIAEIHYLKSNR